MQGELHELIPDTIWIKERPVWFGGVCLRARTTILRLDGGRLWVHSPGEPDEASRAELDRLGEVAWLVIPNRYHHLQAPATKAAYPRAIVIGPETARARNPLVSLDLRLDDPALASALPGFRLVHLDGVPFLDETLFLHEATQTLIGADLMICGCAADHWTWRWSSRLFGQHGRYKAPPDVRWNTKKSDELRRCFDQLGKLPVARVLVAHSDPVIDRPLEQLREAWSFALALPDPGDKLRARPRLGGRARRDRNAKIGSSILVGEMKPAHLASLSLLLLACNRTSPDPPAPTPPAQPPAAAAQSSAGAAPAAPAAQGLHALTAVRLDGKEEQLSRYKGKVLLVVNVASECGYTPQYRGLQALQKDYEGKGFSVLGFPSNDFGGQEPGTSSQIAAFCEKNYGVTFPMFARVATTGAGASPVYALLSAAAGPPRWNFHKYLVGKDGKVRKAFASAVEPASAELRAAIDAALAEPG